MPRLPGSKGTANGKSYSSEDIHRAVFAKTPRARSSEDLKKGIAKYMQKKHARR